MGRQPLRVCFINPYGYPVFTGGAEGPRAFGGAEVQLYYLSTSLARDPGYHVSMIVESPEGQVARLAQGVHLIRMPPQPSWVDTVHNVLPFPWPGYLRAMRRADADVYVQRGGAVVTADVMRFCRRRRRRFVFMVAHDWDCGYQHAGGRQWLKGRYYWRGLRGADLVFAQSQAQQATLQAHHGVSAALFRSVFPDLPPDGQPPRHVLWVGRCVEWKQPLAFLALAERFPQTRFVMVAPGYPRSGDLHARLERRAARLANLSLHGFVPFPEIAGYFSRAIAYVNTSGAEGFPNTFIQAARAGVPVLSLHVDPDGMLGGESMGACAQGDPARLAADLARILGDDRVRHGYGRRGREYFLRTHELASGAAAFRHALDGLRPSRVPPTTRKAIP
jgi:glycosyltransferase involved in cell wall biosynthesis